MGKRPRDRCFVFVIDRVTSHILFSKWLSELDEEPISIIKKRKKCPDGVGGFVEVEVSFPQWIEECHYEQKDSKILEALNVINEYINDWYDDWCAHEQLEYHRVQSCPIVIDVNLCLRESVDDQELLSAIDIIRKKSPIYGLSLDTDRICRTNTIYDTIDIPGGIVELMFDKNNIEYIDNGYYSLKQLSTFFCELCSHNVGYNYLYD